MPKILIHICRVTGFVLMLLLGGVSMLYAQEQLTVKELQLKGDFALKQGDIYGAIDYYDAVLEKQPANHNILFQLGKLQLDARDYAAAHQIFKDIYTTRPAQFPLTKYYYGVSCKRVGKYETAVKVLTEFLKEYKGANYSFFKTSTKREIEGAKLALILSQQSSTYDVVHPGAGINSAYTDFSPVYVSDSAIIYAALKSNSLVEQDASAKKLTHRARFYEAKKDNGSWVTTGEMKGVNTKKAETGNGSFSPDGRRFYFTRCTLDKDDKMACRIYVSKKAGKGWSEPEKLKKNINTRGATTTHPFVTKAKNGDDLLYFTSDRTGGEGKMDIWCAQYSLKTKKWMAPRNLGKRVNTDADEMTPFYDKGIGYLYFSSDGWPSVGGLDVFKVKGEEGKFKSFPENLGFPVNSAADDMYYSMNDAIDKGFIVSNREGTIALKSPTCCDDIFELTVDRTLQFAITGTVAFRSSPNASSKELLPDATVRVYMTGSEVPVGEANSDKNGAFLLELNPEADYYVTVQKENFLSYKSENISTKGLLFSDTLSASEIVLSPLVKHPTKVDNIYFEYDSVRVNEHSRRVIDSSIYRVLVANPNVILEIGAHTDNMGTKDYNLKLSQTRAQMVVNYLIEKGIAAERLQAKGYGASIPIAANTNADGTDNPEGRALNRRIEFRITGEVTVDPDDVSIYSEVD